MSTNAPAPSRQYLAPLSRHAVQKLPALACHPIDDFLSSDVDVDLELSFASTMSLNSPTRGLQELSAEDADYAPMDISPAPQRMLPPSVSDSSAGLKLNQGRARATTSASRLFGRDMSNGSGLLSGLTSSAKSVTGSGGKRLQRSALPVEWLASGTLGRDENVYGQDMLPSPATSDAMDVDSSFVHVRPRPVSRECPLTAAPTITTFNLDNNPLLSSPPASAAPTVTEFNGLYFRAASPLGDSDDVVLNELVDASHNSESPIQPFHKKRRSTSPQPEFIDEPQHIMDDEVLFESSPAASSPSARRLERMASMPLRKPMLSGLGAPLGLNTNKKRPRRPVLSAMLAPGDSPVDKPRSAYPIVDGVLDDEDVVQDHPHILPPVRRAISAMLPPSTLDESMASEIGESFDSEGPDMSSPAQAYAKRQHVKTIRRCDGTDDFRPLTGATALVRRDTEVIMTGLRRSEDRDSRPAENERDTPRSKYLHAGPGLGGFGDNEAYGKILPCQRVREDGLMRINPETLDALVDGAYNSKLASFHIIDCRFDYEYNGGHIPGAVNINTTAGVEEFLLGAGAIKPTPSTSGDLNKKVVLIFHCEFSVKRAPTFAKYLRSKDRALNNHVYPRIYYPEVYILEGGYCQYYQESGARCQPSGYVQMDDPLYAASRKEDLDHFRKGKFGRTKSYSYGEGKMTSLASQQPKRNTAPSGTNALFAAANAARTRRGGMGNAGLQMLPEDKSTGHQTEDEDTDIGDSPCPPPSKGVVFKGKKLNRLAKAESYGPSRMAY
ncbi:hypothetical protein BKA93DRAFT_726553 [Sparassis latifolia]